MHTKTTLNASKLRQHAIRYYMCVREMLGFR